MPALSHPIQLVVGLGNPGAAYAATRHNAGCWLVEKLARTQQLTLRAEKKFQGFYSDFSYDGQRRHVLLPTTFMNLSGQAVAALSQFYDIAPEHILIAHDDLDLPVGDIRLKRDGGHGGHNGLRDIIAHLHSNHFYRLRIGIGHPGDRSAVLDYVLSPPAKSERQHIDEQLDAVIEVLPYLWRGENEKAMQVLHRRVRG